jgi:hypothetical protein
MNMKLCILLWAMGAAMASAGSSARRAPGSTSPRTAASPSTEERQALEQRITQLTRTQLISYYLV